MRLWHKNLIDVLPDNQIKGQWRECCLIAKALHDGNLNHLLVNKVKEYPLGEFLAYTNRVIEAMYDKKKFKVHTTSFFKWVALWNLPYSKSWVRYTTEQIYPHWHNDRYLLQCYYNLQEKYDCGGISEEEWKRVENRVNQLLGGGDQC